MDGRPTWTDCDEAGDYVVPNVLSPRDLVFRPENMDETVPHTPNNYQLISVNESNREAMNRNWSNQNANPALKTKTGNKYYK